jgi:ABC-type transporter Mla subunit MlaD
MKKLLVGCALFVMLGTLAAVAAGYWFVYRPVSGFVGEMKQVATEFEELTTLDRGIASTAPFTPPEDGLLTAEQVERFVAVQRAVAAASEAVPDGGADLEGQIETLETETTTDAAGPEDALARLRDVPARLVGIATTLRGLKQAQVDAVNAQAFSRDEYAWVKRQFFLALGLQVIPANVEGLRTQLENLAPGAAGQIDLNLEAPSGGVVPTEQLAPEANRALVAPFAQEADAWVVWAPFGL